MQVPRRTPYAELPRQAGEIFPNFPDMKTRIPPVLIIFALVCFALVQTQAVSPPPDGAYSGADTAEGGSGTLFSSYHRHQQHRFGSQALFNVTTGIQNTAIGAQALKDDTAMGYGAWAFKRLLEIRPAAKTPPLAGERSFKTQPRSTPPMALTRSIATQTASAIRPPVRLRSVATQLAATTRPMVFCAQ